MRGSGHPSSRDALEARARALVRLAARLAVSDEAAWRTALSEARQSASAVEIEEVLLQSHLFVGFPVVLNAFITWREMDPGVESRSGAGVAESERSSAGEALCRLIYGKAYDRLRSNVRSLSQDLDLWMIEDGYGKTLSRPGLSVDLRELCVVAQLAAGAHDRQLRAHLFGALNAGAALEAVEAAFLEGCETGRQAGRQAEVTGRLAAVWDEVHRKVAG